MILHGDQRINPVKSPCNSQKPSLSSKSREECPSAPDERTSGQAQKVLPVTLFLSYSPTVLEKARHEIRSKVPQMYWTGVSTTEALDPTFKDSRAQASTILKRGNAYDRTKAPLQRTGQDQNHFNLSTI